MGLSDHPHVQCYTARESESGGQSTHGAPGGGVEGCVVLGEGGGVKHHTQDGGRLVTGHQVAKRLWTTPIASDVWR